MPKKVFGKPFKKGNIPWNKGKPRSNKTKEKLRKAHSGKKLSKEHRAKIAAASKRQMCSLGARKKIGDANRGEKHGNWKGGKYKNGDGYVLIKKYNHPNGYSQNYIMEHRFVMSEFLGRPLEKGEIVHHKNGIKDDNRIENLELVLRKKHMGEVTCPYCKKIFKIK